jgi:crotonobetainyl-CoA:carnitine CoA-transferase CaiB-like acyl-CoA transferase
VLDLEAGTGKAALDALVADTDVFITTLHPIELRRHGMDLVALAARHPRLVIVSITPFGLTGPWRDYLSSDLVGMAASGLLITSGYDDHEVPPIRPGGDQVFHLAASFAHIALLLGLTERSSSGHGGLIDVSMHESAGLTVELANPFWFYPRVVVHRQTCRHAQPVPTQPALFECGDGGYVYFAFIVAEPKAWISLIEWMASHDLAADLTEPKYQDVAFRQQQFDHVQGVLECFFLLQDAHVAYHEGQRRGLPIGVLNAPEDLFEDEHLQARNFFVPVEQAGHGEFLRPGPVYRFSAYDAVAPSAAPRLGQHNDEVLGRARTPR